MQPEQLLPLEAALAATASFLRRFVRLSNDAQAVAIALWCAHTHGLTQFETSPYLVITSPEKRSGKTRLLDCLELLVARPWRAVLPTEAVVFRKIAADQPTFLLDEVDAIFNPRTAGQHEGLRALLNAGNRVGTRVPRVQGQMTIVEFDVFSAKALAGIGRLPDTVDDRGIRIRLERRAPREPIERFRFRDARLAADPIRASLDRAIGQLDLSVARPSLPEELNDRAAEGWEPLIAIADAAGADWPLKARAAAVALSAIEDIPETSLSNLMLLDVQKVFLLRAVDRIWTADLIGELLEIEESPWGDLQGRPIGPHALARLLRPYGISPRQVRIREITKKGYLAAEFVDAWNRYGSIQTGASDDTENRNSETAPTSGYASDREDEHQPARRFAVSDSDTYRQSAPSADEGDR